MHDIDFLPARYREKQARQVDRWWRFAVMSAVGLGLAAAAGYQFAEQQLVEADRAVVQPAFDEAVALAERLETVRNQWTAAQSQARLIAYLSHPWPRSQVLATVTKPLPEDVTLTEVKVVRENPAPVAAPVETGRRRSGTADTKGKPKGSETDNDLKELQTDFDKSQVVMLLSGVASDSDALHRYIAALAEDDLVAKAELTSIERVQKFAATPIASEWSQFQVRVRLRPGFGQPDGPTPAEKTSRDRRGLASTKPSQPPIASDRNATGTRFTSALPERPKRVP